MPRPKQSLHFLGELLGFSSANARRTNISGLPLRPGVGFCEQLLYLLRATEQVQATPALFAEGLGLSDLLHRRLEAWLEEGLQFRHCRLKFHLPISALRAESSDLNAIRCKRRLKVVEEAHGLCSLGFARLSDIGRRSTFLPMLTLLMLGQCSAQRAPLLPHLSEPSTGFSDGL